MGLIRSDNTNLTPLSDDKDLTEYLWPIVCEMIKTAIENKQNLIVEGCYIPFDWQKDFTPEYLENIKYYCLVMTEEYIKNNFENIKRFANIIENRRYDDITIENVIRDNNHYLTNAKLYNQNVVLIKENYDFDIKNACQF